MYISGVPGTGKTASTQAVVKELAKEFNFNYVTVNAMELMDPKQLFIEIYKRFAYSSIELIKRFQSGWGKEESLGPSGKNQTEQHVR